MASGTYNTERSAVARLADEWLVTIDHVCGNDGKPIPNNPVIAMPSRTRRQVQGERTTLPPQRGLTIGSCRLALQHAAWGILIRQKAKAPAVEMNSKGFNLGRNGGGQRGVAGEHRRVLTIEELARNRRHL